MSMWKIRIAVPDDAASRGVLTDTLAGQAFSGLRVLQAGQAGSAARPGSTSTSEIMVDLPRDDGLATVLSALHEISPQVFVSRADAEVTQPPADCSL